MHGLNCCPPDEFRTTMNDHFRYLPTTNLMIQIMIQEIESPSILPSKISHILNYRRIERSRYSSSHIYIYILLSYTHTRSNAKHRGTLALSPPSGTQARGRRWSEHEWNKVEQRGKAGENVRAGAEKIRPDKAGPRQGYAGAAVSRSA